MTVDRGALNDDRGEVTEGTDFSLFVHLRCSCRTAQHNLRHYTRSPDRPTAHGRSRRSVDKARSPNGPSAAVRPSVDLAVTATPPPLPPLPPAAALLTPATRKRCRTERTSRIEGSRTLQHFSDRISEFGVFKLIATTHTIRTLYQSPNM